jgi:hypothetical protein
MDCGGTFRKAVLKANAIKFADSIAGELNLK